MLLPILVCCLPVSTCSLQTGGVPHFDKNGIWGGGVIEWELSHPDKYIDI